MTTEFIQHTDQIRNLNDKFRKGDTSLGRIMMTRGVTALAGAPIVNELMSLVRGFDSFNEDNDPHGEHDFFSFTFKDKKLFAKIDYYDTNYEFGSENPADPSKTRRVLTIMLAEEY